MNLYELGREGLAIQDALIESQGELDDRLEERLDLLLAGGKESLEAAAMVVRSLDADADKCREEAKRFTERARSLENQCEALKSRMVFALDTVFSGKLKTPLFTMWAQQGKRTWDFEVKEGKSLEDLQTVWPDAVRVKRELNKMVLNDAWEHDKMPDGLDELLSVGYVEGKRFLRVK